MIPWQAVKPRTVGLMFEMINKAIESLEFHLSRSSNQIDEGLLPRMLLTAQYYPAFSNSQRQQFFQELVTSQTCFLLVSLNFRLIYRNPNLRMCRLKLYNKFFHFYQLGIGTDPNRHLLILRHQ